MPATASFTAAAVRPAREPHDRLAARSPADLLRGDLEQLGRRHASLDQSLAGRGDDQRLPTVGGAQDDGRPAVALELADHLLRQRPELVGVHVLERGDQSDALHLRRLLGDPIDARVDVPLTDLAELGLQPLDALHELAGAVDRGGRVGAPERVDQPAEQRALRVDLAERVRPDQRLHASHPGPDRALVQDLDQRDVARPVHVRPAAQLARVVPHLDHADQVAVLLSEQRDRALRLGLVERGLVDPDGIVERQPPVRLQLGLLQDLERDGRWMREVEAQAARRDERAGLTRVLPQQVLERPVDDVRGRVGARGRLPPLRDRPAACASCSLRTSPDSTSPTCMIAFGPAHCASTTRITPVAVRIVP